MLQLPLNPSLSPSISFSLSFTEVVQNYLYRPTCVTSFARDFISLLSSLNACFFLPSRPFYFDALPIERYLCDIFLFFFSSSLEVACTLQYLFNFKLRHFFPYFIFHSLTAHNFSFFTFSLQPVFHYLFSAISSPSSSLQIEKSKLYTQLILPPQV